jgi:hypothetical protein
MLVVGAALVVRASFACSTGSASVSAGLYSLFPRSTGKPAARQQFWLIFRREFARSWWQRNGVKRPIAAGFASFPSAAWRSMVKRRRRAISTSFRRGMRELGYFRRQGVHSSKAGLRDTTETSREVS